MIEVTEAEMNKLLSEKKKSVIIFYCYTPLCGTCNLARQMLEEWHQSNSTATIYSVNLNLNRTLPLKWQIKSVPYVAIVLNGEKVHQFYAIHSIENIDRQLTPFIRNGENGDKG
ncbi:thioredoxin family protein [Bacillaceae bacterium IKA-2]|nr:thioredoxin family protein [Bacillaceae bacterium IKA-2]